MSKLNHFDEPAICAAFAKLKRIKAVAAQLNLTYTQVYTVLVRHGVEVRYLSTFDERREEILADYRRGDSVDEIGKRYGVGRETVRTALIKEGVYRPGRHGHLIPRGTPGIYAVWIRDHGQEEADRRMAVMAAKKSVKASGKGNPMYGKPAPQRSGNGWKGWYRDWHFRSLREAMFMIELDRKGLAWKSAERKPYIIPYEFMGKARTYRADFIVGNELWELKPKCLHHSPSVVAKRLAAERFCAEHGLTYRLEDIEIRKDVIHEALRAGLIRFDGDYERRFLEYAG